jgi:hypothetical protein
MLISVTMALESLKEQVGALNAAEQAVERERAIRDNLIRDALQAKVSYKALVRITRLSRDRLYTIANNPRRSV